MQIILIIIFSILFIVHYFITKTIYPLIYVIALDVAPMSHMWHLLYGEDRITCVNRKEEVFGWYPCFHFDWNTMVNTYEITLSIEFIFLSALMFYILFDLFKVNILFVINAIHMVLAFILLFSTPSFLDTFAYIFDLSGFIISTILLIMVELFIRIPYFGYTRV